MGLSSLGYRSFLGCKWLSTIVVGGAGVFVIRKGGMMETDVVHGYCILWYENVHKFDVIPLSWSSPYFVRIYILAPLRNSLMDVRVGDVLFLGRRTHLTVNKRDVACSMGAGRDSPNLVLEQGLLDLNRSKLGVIRSGELG